MKLAVLLHLYYDDLFPEIAGWLEKLPEHSLHVTLTFGNHYCRDTRQYLSQHASDWFWCENQGRDVLPFLDMYWHGDWSSYDYVLKIHTKKSTHTGGFGDTWRRVLYTTLMGGCHACFRELSKKSIGMVTDVRFLIPTRVTQRNELAIEQTCRRLEWNPTGTYFAAGSMFWVKPDVLDSLVNFAIDMPFEHECGITDGGTPHVIERLFGIAVKQHGMVLSGVSCTESDRLCLEWEQSYHRSVQDKLLNG